MKMKNRPRTTTPESDITQTTHVSKITSVNSTPSANTCPHCSRQDDKGKKRQIKSSGKSHGSSSHSHPPPLPQTPPGRTMTNPQSHPVADVAQHFQPHASYTGPHDPQHLHSFPSYHPAPPIPSFPMFNGPTMFPSITPGPIQPHMAGTYPHYAAPAMPLHNFGMGPEPLFGWESVIPLSHGYGMPKYGKIVKPDYRRFCYSVGKADVPLARRFAGPLGHLLVPAVTGWNG
ncbi:hypothetical protein M231_05445 [Tremella mesenterica]|uniref:Uncharacterized protein n=1 Tax=Tremella mesenterica TaxID=5217 RepID=A0A4Q1BI37_TREME|nr:hypothetical protein M231_05445 [Tremella mesenterica]